jgi:hypothetical protein
LTRYRQACPEAIGIVEGQEGGESNRVPFLSMTRKGPISISRRTNEKGDSVTNDQGNVTNRAQTPSRSHHE